MNLNNEQRFILKTIIAIILSSAVAIFSGLSSFTFNHFGDFALGLEFEFNISIVFAYLLGAYLFSRPSRLEFFWVVVTGLILSALFWWIRPPQSGLSYSGWLYACIPLKGFGISSFFAIAIGFIKAKNHGEKQRNFNLLIWLAFTATMIAFALVLLRTTITLHPITYDITAYRIDNGFGIQISTFLATFAGKHAYFKEVTDFAYNYILILIAILYGLQISSKKQPPTTILHVWAAALPCALLSYSLVPIAGPAYQFLELFPLRMPELALIANGPSLVMPSFRNGFPSMHLGWALLIWLATAMQGNKWLKVLGPAISILTILATLAKGEHYLIDLVVSVPFIIAIQSFCLRVNDVGQAARHDAMKIGAGIWALWVIAIRYGQPVFEAMPSIVWILSIATIFFSIRAYRRVTPFAAWREIAPTSSSYREKMASGKELSVQQNIRATSRITIMFFISGFTGLMYEVIFSKELALTFGGTSTATYTVLTVYMGGMAIGSWLGGKLVSAKRNALVSYAICELFIGLYCLCTPFLFDLTQQAYVSLAADIAPDSGILLVLRITCGALVLLIPTICMGMTLPIMVTDFERRGHAVGNAVSRLYSANTLGAATGALLAGYLILPVMGVWKTTALCAIGSLLAALIALKLSNPPPAEIVEKNSDSLRPTNESVGLRPLANPQVARHALFALFTVGVVTMIMEVEYMLLLAVVAGNSTYGFSLMLFSLLLGLGAGAMLARHLLSLKIAPDFMFACLLMMLSAVLLLGIFQWDKISDGFAAYQQYPHPLEFATREWIRGIACWLMMFPPAVIIGACYPIALEVIGTSAIATGEKTTVGSAVALNTIGNIIGVLMGGFVLLPIFGALTSIQLAAGLSLIAAGVLLWSTTHSKKLVSIVGAAVFVAIFLTQPSSFNYNALASGANVYFATQPVGKIIAHSESLDGGLTSVSVHKTKEIGEFKTLLTNGKFQGNNVMNGEMKAQLGFAVAPLLHTTMRSNALVIGYGTGVSARALKEAGFENIDIVDLSGDLVSMANTHFSNVNKKISEATGVQTFITDGRNFLLLKDKTYDLIGMEISSIWFAGAASLYNREFYELAAKRITKAGILQQWVQLHHTTPLNIAYILGSVRAEFPYVWFYVIGDQGIIIASKSDKSATASDALARIQSENNLMSLFNQVGTTPSEILESLTLDPKGVDRLLSSFGIPPEELTSTDDNLFLEFSTPRGNALDGQISYKNNLMFLKKFSP